jgi:DNA mismatch endonuclease (patch repair protein)
MADVHTKEVRSYNMSRIRSKNTKPEMQLRKILFASNFRFRLHLKELPGKPDIILKKYNTVIFVHGCFWHGHENCRFFKIPKTRTEWWDNKIKKNKNLDMQHEFDLKELGWNIIIVYECQLKKDKLEKTVQKLISTLRSNYEDSNNKITVI